MKIVCVPVAKITEINELFSKRFRRILKELHSPGGTTDLIAPGFAEGIPLEHPGVCRATYQNHRDGLFKGLGILSDGGLRDMINAQAINYALDVVGCRMILDFDSFSECKALSDSPPTPLYSLRSYRGVTRWLNLSIDQRL